MSPSPRAAQEAAALRLTLVVYAVVFAMKLAVWLATGVMAIFAEALHTLTDLFISSFLLAAAVWSRRSADELHHFGHGRAQNAAALAAAVLFISFTSYKLYEEAIPPSVRARDDRVRESGPGHRCPSRLHGPRRGAPRPATA